MKETRNFKATKNGGAVEVKEPNVWVVLAPYFYPTFTVLWFPFWFLVVRYKEDVPFAMELFFGILALTWAYHLVMTLYILKFEQSDITRYGKIFSYSLIIFINTLTVFIFLSLITDGIVKACTYLSQIAVSNFGVLCDLFRSL
jgi:hypothetical protein